MSLLILPIFCVSAGFVVYLVASGILIGIRGRSFDGSRSTRRERKAAQVIGVAGGLVLAFTLGAGSGLGVAALVRVDLLIFLVTAG